MQTFQRNVVCLTLLTLLLSYHCADEYAVRFLIQINFSPALRVLACTLFSFQSGVKNKATDMATDCIQIKRTLIRCPVTLNTIYMLLINARYIHTWVLYLQLGALCLA